MSNDSTFVSRYCWTNNVRRFDPSLIVSRLHVQVRLMGQFGLGGGIPWLRDSDSAFCSVCKHDVESVTHFLLDCSYFKQNFLSLWRNLKLKITVSNQVDGINICQFIDNLDCQHKVPLLLGGLCLPFDNVTNTLIKRFIAAAVGKINISFAEKGYVNWRHHG